MFGATKQQGLCKRKKMPTRVWSRAILLTLGTMGQASAFVPTAFNSRQHNHPLALSSHRPTIATYQEDPIWATRHSGLFSSSSSEGSRPFTPKSPAWSSPSSSSSSSPNATAPSSSSSSKRSSPFVRISEPPPRGPWGEVSVSLEGGVRVASGGVVPKRWAVLVASSSQADRDNRRTTADQARRSSSSNNNRRPSSPSPSTSVEAGKAVVRGQGQGQRWERERESRWADSVSGSGRPRNLTAAQRAGDWRQRKQRPANATLTLTPTAAVVGSGNVTAVKGSKAGPRRGAIGNGTATVGRGRWGVEGRGRKVNGNGTSLAGSRKAFNSSMQAQAQRTAGAGGGAGGGRKKGNATVALQPKGNKGTLQQQQQQQGAKAKGPKGVGANANANAKAQQQQASSSPPRPKALKPPLPLNASANAPLQKKPFLLKLKPPPNPEQDTMTAVNAVNGSVKGLRTGNTTRLAIGGRNALAIAAAASAPPKPKTKPPSPKVNRTNSSNTTATTPRPPSSPKVNRASNNNSKNTAPLTRLRSPKVRVNVNVTKVNVTRLVMVNGTARLASSVPKPKAPKSSNSNLNLKSQPKANKGERGLNSNSKSSMKGAKGGIGGERSNQVRKGAAVAQASSSLSSSSSLPGLKTPPKTDAQRNAGSKVSGRDRVAALLSSSQGKGKGKGQEGQPPSGEEVKRLINYCLRRQEWDAVLSLVAAEESRQLPLNADMLDLAIALMGRAGRTQEAATLAQHMHDRGLHSGQKTRNALLGAYSLAEGPEASAKVSSLLSEMREAGQVDIVAVNTLMKAYVNKGEEGKALSLLEEMLQWGQGLEPDLITYTTAITACGARWERALSLLWEAESRLPLDKVDPQLYTAAMKACRAADRTDKVLEVYERMTSRGHVDVVACNSVLEALRQKRDGDAALQFLQDMKRKGPQPNSVNYNTVMDTLATEGKVDQVLLVLEEMKASGSVKPNQRSYTVAMKACVTANQGERGAQLFQDMRRELQVSGDCVAYGTLIDLYASTGSLEQLRGLELEIGTRRGLFKDVRIYTALIRGYGVLREWSCALRVLERMRDRGVRPTIVTYGTLMKVLGECGRHAEASQLLKDMEADGMAATDIVYEGAASAYKSAGRLDKVLQLKWRRLTRA